MTNTSNDPAVKAISNKITSLRAELAAFTKETQDKLAGLEIAYEALTGEKHPEPVEGGAPVRRRTRQVPTKGQGRRGMRIDRQGAAKTYEFIKSRGERATTVNMVARKFGISKEAASQRMLNLHKDGKTARVAKGSYVAAAVVTQTDGNGNGGNGARKTEAEAQ